MIKAVKCDKPDFKEVRFEKGFNVVLADRTKSSGERDSRNGLGKTTLIEIIHFCLGASTKPNKGLRVPELNDWTFSLELTLLGKDYTVSRNTKNPGIVKFDNNDFLNWCIKPEYDTEEKNFTMKIKDWNLVLGYLMFGINPEILEKCYSPTFRSLISYFARRGTEAFEDAFKHHSQQQTWDVQVNNAFLLDLNWEYAAKFQLLKDEEKTLKNLRKAAEQGLLAGYIGSIGELEAERINLEEKTNSLETQLIGFKVHQQYAEIQEEANQLTQQIHELVNQQNINKRLLKQYNISVKEEKDIPLENVEKVYYNSGFVFDNGIKKKLNEVLEFHTKVIENRKNYLHSEINRLSDVIEKQSDEIKKLSDKRAELFEILNTHGALEEYVKIQAMNTDLKQQLKEIENRIENLKRFETGISKLKIKKEELLQKARRDFDERKTIVDNARRLFNWNSKYLYAEPGMLNIDLKDIGYIFDIEIKRTRSQGIGYMKVFCYDLMLAQLRAELQDTPGFLIHDSAIFNGVDERQIAKALELAAKLSTENSFQYIVTLNSDQVPYNDFTDNFKLKFNNDVRITLTDDTDEGGLLGIRY